MREVFVRRSIVPVMKTMGSKNGSKAEFHNNHFRGPPARIECRHERTVGRPGMVHTGHLISIDARRDGRLNAASAAPDGDDSSSGAELCCERGTRRRRLVEWCRALLRARHPTATTRRVVPSSGASAAPNGDDSSSGAELCCERGTRRRRLVEWCRALVRARHPTAATLRALQPATELCVELRGTVTALIGVTSIHPARVDETTYVCGFAIGAYLPPRPARHCRSLLRSRLSICLASALGI